MATQLTKNLAKSESITLTKSDGTKLTNFFVGCSWGAITKKSFLGLTSSTVDVDLDLSCLIFDAKGNAIDHIWSPLFRFGDNKLGLPNGKLTSLDGALRHTGDDLTGDTDPDGILDNEAIMVDLNHIDKHVSQIVFFLNIYNDAEYQGDFSGISSASIRIYEGSRGSLPNGAIDLKPKEVFAHFNVATKDECAGMRGLVMGKLSRSGGDWKFCAIGDAFPDKSIVLTIGRVMKYYNK